MPPPRKPSPRRSRRSRSRSYSPRHSRKRSHSRSPRPKRRSRTPERKRGKSPKHYEPELSYHKRKSLTPKRSPPRKSHLMHERRSPSEERDYLVKRPADSSGKRQGYRSRSGSPVVSKRTRDSSRYDNKEEKLYSSKRHRSPSPPSSHKGRSYDEEPSSSSRPLFPVESKPRKEVIDLVRIIDKKERQTLNKRFQTEEQAAEGPFDFEENITIGIHRGPNHLDQEAVHVNFVFDPKAFFMLFPKKDYKKAIFNREEILAFRHDDNLDEETYVEKRTITVKPSNKPKSKWEDQSDYKITIGADREGYGDRRMVHDSGSRSRSSKHKYYEQDVKIKLDPKPDPRYEKIYREQQRKEEELVLKDKIHRNPNDLRYNLMKKTERRTDRSPNRDMEDARSRIEARRREGWSPERSERRERRSSRESPERKKITLKTDLPDFKNRPARYLDRLHKPIDDEVPNNLLTRWGYCEICKIPINSEEHALAHVNGLKHRKLEAARDYGKQTDTRRDHRLYEAGSDDRYRDSQSTHARSSQTGVRSSEGDTEKDDHYTQGTDQEGEIPHVHKRPKKLEDDRHIWIIGAAEMKSCEDRWQTLFDQKMGLERDNITVSWSCRRGFQVAELVPLVQELKRSLPTPNAILLHIGGNDLVSLKTQVVNDVLDALKEIDKIFPDVKIIWGQLLPRFTGKTDAKTLNMNRLNVDDRIATHVISNGGHYMRFPRIYLSDRRLYEVSKDEDLNLTETGTSIMLKTLRDGILSIVLRNISITPDLLQLPPLTSRYISQNVSSKAGKKRFYNMPFRRSLPVKRKFYQ